MNQRRPDSEKFNFYIVDGRILPVPVEEFANPNHDQKGRFTESPFTKTRQPGGGATLDSKTGANVTEGYAVALEGHSSITPTEEFFSGPKGKEKGRQILKDWIKKAHKDGLLKDPNIKIGLWHDEVHNEIVIDASEQVMDRTKAIHLGRERDQQGIYHLVPGGEGYIDTGGTGGRE
jgi:hypothetical protein